MASGQCYGCGVGFGVFRKEHGCKNCGFAFCTKCLTKTLPVPKLNNAKHHVCNKCYDILTGKVSAEQKKSYSPPEAYKKRVAALEEREKNPGAAHHNKPKTNVNKSKYINLSKADREIAERLDKLKEKPQPETKVTDKDITDRLSRLRGEDPTHKQTGHTSQTGHTHKFYHPPDTRPQQKQVDDLLDEICNEVEIDSHQLNSVPNLQHRLDSLKGATGGNSDVENNLNKPSSSNGKMYNKNINVSGEKEDNENLEDITRLIAEASKELELDANKAIEDLQKDKEIMERLNEIKNRKKKETDVDDAASVSDDENSENEDVTVKKLVKRYLEESKLDDEMGEDITMSKQTKPSQTTKEYYDADELPYCCMCTEDACIRCIDCDMDLYCKSCFRESHDKIDITDHRKKKYTPPKDS